MVSLLNRTSVTLFALVLVGVASWALYNIVQEFLLNIMIRAGIESFYWQNIAIIGVAAALLLLIGWRSKKIIKKLVG